MRTLTVAAAIGITVMAAACGSAAASSPPSAPRTATMPPASATAPATTAPATTAPAAAATAPAGFTSCGSGVYAGPDTSCPFALNVWRAATADGDTPAITAYSPVTGKYYSLALTSTNPYIYNGASNGNTAIVEWGLASNAAAPASAPAPATPTSTASCTQQMDTWYINNGGNSGIGSIKAKWLYVADTTATSGDTSREVLAMGMLGDVVIPGERPGAGPPACDPVAAAAWALAMKDLGAAGAIEEHTESLSPVAVQDASNAFTQLNIVNSQGEQAELAT